MTQEVGSLKAKVGLDTVQFNQGIATLSKQMQIISQDFKNASAGLDKVGDAAELNRLKITRLSAQIDEQKKIVDQFRTAHQKATDQFGEGSKKALDYELKLKKAEGTLQSMERQLVTATAELKRQESAFTALGTKMNSVSKSCTEFGTKMKDVGKNLSMTVTAPIVGLGVAAVKVGMDFEAAMSRVKAISGATGEEFKKLNDLALKLGADTTFSAKQAAEGMENLASAGFKTNEVMAAMPGMLDLAASGGLDIASASEIAASALRGFGLDAEQSGHVADVLAKAAADTNAEVTGMGMSLKYAAPPAAALGMSLEEVSAAIGEMANVGIKGEMAGTTLRGSLLSLASPTKEASGMMKDLSFNAFDAQGKMLPFGVVIGKLKTALKGLTDEKKADALATIFGRESLSGMMALVDAGPEKFDELTRSFKNSDGAAKAMAATMLDNTKGSLEQMKGSLETAAITLSTVLAPSIIAITAKITELANKFAALGPETQKTILVIAGIAAVVGPVLIIVGTLVTSIGAIAGAVGAASTAIAAAGGIMTVITGPIGIAIAAIAALVAGGILLYKNWDTIKAKVKELGDKIKEAWENIKAKTSEIWNGIIEFFKKWYPLLLTVTLGPLGMLIAGIIGHWDEIKAKTAEIWNGIKSFFTTWWNGIVSWVSSWAIWPYVASAWNSFKTNVIDVLSGLASDALGWGGNIVQGLIDGMSGFIGRAVDAAKNLAAGVNDAIKNFLGISSPSKVMIEFGQMVSQGLADGIKKRGDKAAEEITRISSAIKGAASKMLSDLSRSLDLAKEKFSLARLSLGDNPSEGSELSLQLQELGAESATIAENLEVLNEAYRRSVEATGENSDESKQLAYELAKEEIAQKKNQIQVANATKAKDKLSSSSVLLQARMEDLADELDNLEGKHRIETAMLGDSANEASKYALEVRQGNETLGVAKERLDLVTAAYNNAKITTGENSEETRNLYKELLEAKLSYEDLKSNITDTTDKMNEQINTAEDLKDRIVDLSRVNAGLPESGRSSSHFAEAIANSGDIPTPEETGLDSTRIGSDGLTDYTRAIRDSLLRAGSVVGSTIPGFAEGALVSKPTLAMLGEGNESEGIMPLSKLQPMMTNALMGAIQGLKSAMSGLTPSRAAVNQPLNITLTLDGAVLSRQLYYINQGILRGAGA